MARANRFRSTPTSSHPESLFEADQSLGGLIPTSSASLLAAGKHLLLSDRSGGEIQLTDQSSWDSFIQSYLRAKTTAQTDRDVAEGLFDSLGIPFTSFVRLIDDLVAAPEQNILFDCRAGTDLSHLLRLYEADETYGLPPAGQEIDALNGSEGNSIWSVDLPGTDEGKFSIDVSRAILPRIVLSAPDTFFGRDREEIEAFADFQVTAESWRRFARGAGIDIWIPLDLEGLGPSFWEDPVRMALVQAYNLPLHLEKDNEEQLGYRITRRQFFDVYLDTEDGKLASNDLSLRARLRFERKRGLIQMKEEKAHNPQTGRPIREKWERRLSDGYLGDVLPTMDEMITYSQYGFATGAPMPEIKKLLTKLIEKGEHDEVSKLYLRPDHIILQERRRTHLRLDSIDTVSERLRFAEDAASQLNPVPSALASFIQKVRDQLAILQAAKPIMEAYGFKRMVEGEAVIISRDRWLAAEPGAYGPGDWPDDWPSPSFEGIKGLRGRGLRAEAELDSFTSDPIEHVLRKLEELFSETGDAKYKQDMDVVRELQRLLFEDVALTVRLQRDRYVTMGLTELTDLPHSKSEQAQAMIAEGQGGFRRGHRFWI